METKIKIKGGHTVSFDWRGVFITDDSGERREVDTERDITADGRAFDIPLVGGNVTAAGAEEAMFIASMTGQKITAGARSFVVQERGL